MEWDGLFHGASRNALEGRKSRFLGENRLRKDTGLGKAWKPACSLRVGYADDEALAERAGGAGDGVQGDGDVARVEEAVELGAAGMKLLGHGALGLLLLPHGLLQLPRQHALNDSLDLFTNAFGFEKTIEG